MQDLGRVAQRRQGVSVGGALDLFAARVANLLVGNAEETALLEISFGGVRLRFNDERNVAWCGGYFPRRASLTRSFQPDGLRSLGEAKSWSSGRANVVPAPGSQLRAGSKSHLFSAADRPICAPGSAVLKDAPCVTAMSLPLGKTASGKLERAAGELERAGGVGADRQAHDGLAGCRGK